MKKIIIKQTILSSLFLLLSGCSNDTLYTTGFGQEMNEEVSINDGTPRTGIQVYENRCKTCHDRNTQGAPMPDDEYEWNKRAAKGTDVLMEHIINGYQRTLMPARGGCLNCSDEELRNALNYILKRSGVKAEK